MIGLFQLISTTLYLLVYNQTTSSITEVGIEGIINTTNPINVPISAIYKKGLRYFTMKEELPEILSSFANDLHQNRESIIDNFGQDAENDIQVAIKSFADLRNEMDSNKPLTPLVSSRSDVPVWNKFLQEQTKKQGNDLTWYKAAFLYTECYFYRRVNQIFELSNTLQNFDFCRKKKESTLIHSMESCSPLANYLLKDLDNSVLTSHELRKLIIRLIKMSLWSNRFDLSISLGHEASSTVNPTELVDHLEDYLLVDDTEKIWETLLRFRNTNNSIDIVNDNSGYELFADLCLADFLLTYGFATTIRFHVKAMPWYVSDALADDVRWTVDILSKFGTHSSSLPELSKRWKNYLTSGRWQLHTSDFWTLPYEYCLMPKTDPALYQKLSQSSLLFFKGDLNYRKLLAGFNWPPTENFTTTLQGFQPTNLVALRTVKSEVVCGLQPGKFEELSAKNSKWNSCGDYGLIQYSGK